MWDGGARDGVGSDVAVPNLEIVDRVFKEGGTLLEHIKLKFSDLQLSKTVGQGSFVFELRA